MSPLLQLFAAREPVEGAEVGFGILVAVFLVAIILGALVVAWPIFKALRSWRSTPRAR